MTIWHEDYRGYEISFQGGDRYALIMPPGAEEALSERPEVDLGEGRIELRHKAHAVIDAAVAHGSKQTAAQTLLAQ